MYGNAEKWDVCDGAMGNRVSRLERLAEMCARSALEQAPIGTPTWWAECALGLHEHNLRRSEYAVVLEHLQDYVQDGFVP